MDGEFLAVLAVLFGNTDCISLHRPFPNMVTDVAMYVQDCCYILLMTPATTAFCNRQETLTYVHIVNVELVSHMLCMGF